VRPHPVSPPRLALVAVLVLALAAALSLPSPAAASEPDLVVTYTVSARGPVTADLDTFREVAAETFGDPRGWSLGGAIEFVEVPTGGQFDLILATPDQVVAADPTCEAAWSCRVDDEVLINEQRWLHGSLGYLRPLADYRAYVVNHEVGHWLGLPHALCAGFVDAPVMVQQSKGTGTCAPTVWPLDSERGAVGFRWGVPVRDPLATMLEPALRSVAEAAALVRSLVT
jgi:hypothetical protein